MSLQQKWDEKYHQTDRAGEAAKVLADNTHLLPCAGTALDLACGLGANAFCLAENGLSVFAWDISPIAISRLQQSAKQAGVEIVAEVRDVIDQPPLISSFDVIVVSHFLQRDLVTTISQALKPSGLLFYQTFCVDKVKQIGPTNPDYLLKNNELINLFADLDVRVYREEQCLGDVNKGWRNQAMLVAQKPDS